MLDNTDIEDHKVTLVLTMPPHKCMIFAFPLTTLAPTTDPGVDPDGKGFVELGALTFGPVI